MFLQKKLNQYRFAFLLGLLLLVNEIRSMGIYLGLGSYLDWALAVAPLSGAAHGRCAGLIGDAFAGAEYRVSVVGDCSDGLAGATMRRVSLKNIT